ncbi:NUDIX domain-containing protein [Nonomuraea sp. NPDC000554]|uniref:NUDIX hydrolase n=1 Tax=Nonomuraea sp. NPDC000554 TaxID=3154259 RepID=UPI00331E0731
MIPLRRFTARALPIDEQGRVLLLHGFDPARPDEPFWFTIGGALEDGETLQQAAARELHEEVGIKADANDFTGPYGTNTIEFTFAQYAITQDQTFYAIRVDDPTVSFANMEGIEQETTLGHRWWSAEDLEATGETYFPENLPAILREITTGAAPE